MPLDPRIPLQTQFEPVDFGAALQRSAQLRQFATQDDAARQRMTLEQQQGADLHADRQARTAAVQQEQTATQEAAAAYAAIKGGNAEEVLKTLNPRARTIAEGWLKEFQAGSESRLATMRAHAKTDAQTIRDLNYDPVVAGTIMQLRGDEYPEFRQLWDSVKDNPDGLKRAVDHYATLGDKPEPDYTLNQGDKRFKSGTNQLLAENPKADPVAPRRADFTIGDTRYDGETGKPIVRNPRAVGGQGLTGNAQNEQTNAHETALGIADGTTSPEVLLSSRATAQGMALQAELHKMGVDANKITREWGATKRAIAALNSTQQLRLAETINKASASLDKLDELNTEWSKNATRWGIKVVNRASLAAAQNGLYGQEAASVAQRLSAQISDVTSELGQSIMGGNSPTDHALKLAATNLSTDWTQKVLADSIKQVRYNLNLAQNARNEILQGLGVTSTQVQVPVPSAVSSALQSVGPGRHTLSDGSVWMKDANGVVTKAN